jgi:hypothetical protein
MIDQFRASAARNHSTILLGAGASAGSGLPDWNTLAQQLLVHSGSATGLSTKHRYPVNHLHGVITRRRPESVDVTLSDFTTLIAGPRSWQLAYLKKAVSRGTLIIAGTSYRDPNLRQ